MKVLVLSVLFGFVLTVSVANQINQQDAAPDSSRDAADALESYNPERKSEDFFPSNSDEESDEDSFDDETRVSDETPGENRVGIDEDEDDAEDDEHLAVTGPLKKVSDPFPIRFRRLVRAGRRIIRGRRVAIRNAIRRFLRRRSFRG